MQIISRIYYANLIYPAVISLLGAWNLQASQGFFPYKIGMQKRLSQQSNLGVNCPVLEALSRCFVFSVFHNFLQEQNVRVGVRWRWCQIVGKGAGWLAGNHGEQQGKCWSDTREKMEECSCKFRNSPWHISYQKFSFREEFCPLWSDSFCQQCGCFISYCP